MLGLFGWSNYSQRVVLDIEANAATFREHGIAVAAFSAYCAAQISEISPQFIDNYLTATNEPLMYVLEAGSLKKSRFGPANVDEIIKWVNST